MRSVRCRGGARRRGPAPPPARLRVERPRAHGAAEAPWSSGDRRRGRGRSECGSRRDTPGGRVPAAGCSEAAGRRRCRRSEPPWHPDGSCSREGPARSWVRDRPSTEHTRWSGTAPIPGSVDGPRVSCPPKVVGGTLESDRTKGEPARRTMSILPALREHIRLKAEDRPGVYRMIGGHGDILYVGKSVRLRTRLLSYFN